MEKIEAREKQRLANQLQEVDGILEVGHSDSQAVGVLDPFCVASVTICRCRHPDGFT